MAVDALSAYDPTNVFARILRREIPCRKVYDDAHVLAFHDINPLAPVHVLVIPKGEYVSMADFLDRAGDAEITGFWRGVARVIAALNLAPGGFRMLSNAGRDAGQEVPHMHLHIFAGRELGPMLGR
jgi:diadenosine tetraphosphate (Ap4A) HIT family hydrolase